MIKILCLNCGCDVLVKEKEIKRGFGKFCSLSCSAKFRAKNNRAKPNIKCSYCGKEFYRNASKRKNSKSGIYFCCRLHKDLSQRFGGVISNVGNGEYSYRAIALRIYGPKCNRCGFDNHVAAIVVHHKDRNRSNNNPSNLEVLCSNCHSIEHWSKNEIVEPMGNDPIFSVCKTEVLPN
jgi:hypothetical protein